jgi:hypothetical protein
LSEKKRHDGPGPAASRSRAVIGKDEQEEDSEPDETGARNPIWFTRTPAVQATALYWGLVDIIWTVVFVILYLPGRT